MSNGIAPMAIGLSPTMIVFTKNLLQIHDVDAYSETHLEIG